MPRYENEGSNDFPPVSSFLMSSEPAVVGMLIANQSIYIRYFVGDKKKTWRRLKGKFTWLDAYTSI